jgi:flagellar biosynthesis/type III secretory pathway chaperone
MSPITTPAEAEKLLGDLTVLIEKLSELVEQETTLMHAGQIRAASAIEPAKAELAGRLYTLGERLKANSQYLRKTMPERCTALARLQDGFRAVLQKNTIVLATAHAVSEGIMRRLSGDLARKAAPQTYGASGRTAAPNPKYGRPLAVSRSL